MGSAEDGGEAAQPVIFVVDDDPALCSALKFALELEGFLVRTYANGSALLADAAPHRGDCLVIDQRLPGMNGLELLAQLRQRDVRSPAVLITSYPDAMLRQAAARAGVSIVEKPLLNNALGDEIRRLLAPPAEPGR